MYQLITHIILLYKLLQPTCETTITPGIYLQRLPNISFYETSTQILFRFVQPVQTEYGKECVNYICTANPNFCKKYLTPSTYLDAITPNFTAEHLTANDKILMDDGDLFDIQYITRTHVPRVFTTPYEIDLLTKQNLLKRKLPINEIHYETPIPFFNPNTANCNSPLFMSAIIAERLLLYEWTRSLAEMCQHKIPHIDVIPIQTLEIALSKVKTEALAYNFSLSLEYASSYYTLPLLECAISKQATLIGIHVPLIRNALHGLTMRRIINPPFAWNRYTCAVSIPTIDVAYKQHIPDTWKFLTPSCDPFKENLCFLNRAFEHNPLAISCVKHLLQDSTGNQLSTACPIECRDTGTETEFLTQLDVNHYLITHPHPNTTIQCNHIKHPLPEHNNIGAILLQLPCKCSLQGQDATIVANKVSCLEEVDVQLIHILPAQWMKFKSLTIPKAGKSQLNFDTLADCLDDKWILRLDVDINNYLPYFLIALCIALILINSAILYVIAKQLRLVTKTLKRNGLRLQCPSSQTGQQTFSSLLPPQPTHVINGSDNQQPEENLDYLIPSPVIPTAEVNPRPLPSLPTNPPPQETTNRRQQSYQRKPPNEYVKLSQVMHEN